MYILIYMVIQSRKMFLCMGLISVFSILYTNSAESFQKYWLIWLLCLDSIHVFLEFQVKNQPQPVQYSIDQSIYLLLSPWSHLMDFTMMQQVNLSCLSQLRNGERWEFIFVNHFCTLNLTKLLDLGESFYINYKDVKSNSPNIIQMTKTPKEKVIRSQKGKTFPKKNCS